MKTKKRGLEVMKVWKRAYERSGWTVRSFGGEAYIAYPPDWEDTLDASQRAAIVLREFDQDGKRIHPTPRVRPAAKPMRGEERAPGVDRPVRRGRSTPAWA